jgi:pentatricopeptide repeat protein
LQKDVPIRTYIFSQVITTCTRKNATNEAMAVFDLMVERNIPLNDYIVDDLLTICTEKLDKRGDDVINYFRGTPYSAKVFNLVLLYHAKMKQIPQLIECLKQAKQKNVLLRVFIISSIAEACLYKESLEGGKLIQEYIFANPNLEHRIYPLNGLVQLYCNCGEIETAIHLVKNFKKLSIEPVEFTYTTILSAVTVKDVQCGRWVHEQLKKTKMYESAQVRSKIIQMYANCGEINTAVNLFKEMVADRVEIDDYTYSLMLGICVDHKLLDFGEFVCQTIQATKHAPDSNTLKKMEVFLQLWRTTKETKE